MANKFVKLLIEVKIMKRIYILICAVVLLMSGCSQTTQQETNEISNTEDVTVLGTTKELTIEETTETEDTAEAETTPSCSEKDNLTEEVEYTLFTDKVNNLDGVTATVKESTSTTITIELSNTTSLEILYGNDYDLQIQIEDNWYSLPKILDNWAFPTTACKLEENSFSEWSVDWSSLYGELEKGHYRIVKSLIDYRVDYHIDYYIATEFDVE